MAVTLYTEDQLFAGAMGYFRLAFPTEDLSDKGFFGLLARTFARFMVLAQQQILQVDNDAVPAYQQDADGNLRSRCSSEALDAWAFVFGLPSNTPGIYGRKGATISTGGVGIPSGVATTLIPAGTQAVDSTTQIIVELTANVTLNGPPNTEPASFVSVTTGEKANLSAGSVLTWLSPPAGVDPTVTLTSALVGAEDRESDFDLLARILRRTQTPPRGGTAADYRTWTEEAVDVVTLEQLGIERGYIYPERSGLGSVDIVPLQAGSGAARVPGAATLAKVLAYVNTKRPVTAAVNVLAALAAAGNALRIRVRITPSPAKGGQYDFDWNDGAIGTLISAHSTGAKTISCLAPAALITAFNNNLRPRVQIINSAATASSTPFQARVTGIALGVPDVLTLDSFPAAGPMDGVDYFYSGGGAVDLVASRLLTYVDGLGPSRQSGFADDYDAWETNVTLARIADIVMETKDADGTRMILDIPNLATVGITIAVGTGTFMPNSYTPKDIGMGIELPFLREGGVEVVRS